MGFFDLPDTMPMSPEEFRLLRDLVYGYCGNTFKDDVKYLFERRLGARVRFLELKNYNDYYRYLRYNPNRRQELEAVVELLTTNETYFFREEYQLKALSEEILPEIIDRHYRDRHLRIWSAGCSTGEEAYTVAMLVLESCELDNWKIEIFGNDISRKVLQTARKGVYRKSSFRTINEYYKKKYFTECGDTYRINDNLRTITNFGQLNLLDDQMLQLLSKVDLILCRNVLIYFDTLARQKVVGTFYDKLYNHGYLLLGHSESLMNISTDFELVYLKNDMVYRKPASVQKGDGIHG